MKRLTLFMFLLSLTNSVFALPIVSLVPERDKIHAGENLAVDVVVSGLQDGGVNSLVGAFSMDVLFNSNLQLIIPASHLGTSLGDPDPNNGEVLVGANPYQPGDNQFSFYEVSLLDSLALDALQNDSFSLATLTFYLPYLNNLQSGTTISFSTANVVLSDDLGNQLAMGVNPGAVVRVSEPSPIVLLVVGFLLLVMGKNLSGLKRIAKQSGAGFLVKASAYLVSLLAIVPLQIQAATGGTIVNLVGDRDGFQEGDTVDKAPKTKIVEDLLAYITAPDHGQNDAVDLDKGGANRPVGLSHLFTIPTGTRIASAVVTFRVRSSDPLVYNDGIYYDKTVIPTSGALLPVIVLRDLLGREPRVDETVEIDLDLAKVPVRAVDTTNGPGGHWSPERGAYRNLLSELLDGQLDLVFSDDLTVDFSELRITYVSATAPGGDVTGDGVIDSRDVDLITNAIGTQAYSGDPRDLDKDGKITVLDSRKLVRLCAKPLCAKQVVQATWNGAVKPSGNWVDANWIFNPLDSGKLYPNNGLKTYNVLMGGLNNFGSDIKLNRDIIIDSLSPSTGSSLHIQDNHSLRVGVISASSGNINISGAGSYLKVGGSAHHTEGGWSVSEKAAFIIKNQFTSGSSGASISGPGSFLQIGSYYGGGDVSSLSVSSGATVTTLNKFDAGHGDGGVSVSGIDSVLTASSYTQTGSQETSVNDYGQLRIYGNYDQNYAQTIVSNQGKIDISGTYNLNSRFNPGFHNPAEDLVDDSFSKSTLEVSGGSSLAVGNLHMLTSNLVIEDAIVFINSDLTVSSLPFAKKYDPKYDPRDPKKVIFETPESVISGNGSLIVVGNISLSKSDEHQFLHISGVQVEASNLSTGVDSSCTLDKGARVTIFNEASPYGISVNDVGTELLVGGHLNTYLSVNGGLVRVSNLTGSSPGGVSNGGRVFVDGLFRIHGDQVKTLTQGVVVANRLSIEGGNGQIVINDGAIQVGGNVYQPNVTYGKLKVLDGGVLSVFGQTGLVGTEQAIIGDVQVDGGVIEPGSADVDRRMLVKGNYSMNGGRLIIDIAGKQQPDVLEPGGFDIVDITGNANFTGGEVVFRFTNGFVPKSGDSFQFFKATAGVTNFNANLKLEGFSVNNVQYQVDKVANGLVLRIL